MCYLFLRHKCYKTQTYLIHTCPCHARAKSIVVQHNNKLIQSSTLYIIHRPKLHVLSIIIYNMGFLHLFIVNKAGGLILHRPLGPAAPKIDTNEWLRIGSTFHSLHAIAAEASPVKLPGNKNSCKHIIRIDM